MESCGSEGCCCCSPLGFRDRREMYTMSATASELLERGKKGRTFGELVDRSEEVSEGERET